MTDQRTTHLDLPLPHPSNELSEDVGRLRELVTLLDALLNALNTGKSSVGHGHEVGDVEGLASALTALVPKLTEVQAGSGLVGGGALAEHINIGLGTPGTLTAESENEVSGNSHTHKVMFPVMIPASQKEMEAGTEQEIRSMSPLHIAQAIHKIIANADFLSQESVIYDLEISLIASGAQVFFFLDYLGAVPGLLFTTSIYEGFYPTLAVGVVYDSPNIIQLSIHNLSDDSVYFNESRLRIRVKPEGDY